MMKPTCPKCGSDDVSSDATAYWSVSKQDWELGGLYDNKSCNACGEDDIDLIWVTEQI